jgi:L-lactate dehydrogenase
MRIGIIGAGAVGSACLTAVVTRGFAREVVVLERDRSRARALVTDLQYGAVLSPAVELHDGDYADLAGASVVMITAGINEMEGGATDRRDPAGRLRLLDKNFLVVQEIIRQLDAIAPEAMVLVVTDPPDPLADAVRMLGHERVLSTGTYLDTLRFRFHLARRLAVSPVSVDAYVLGEHGMTEVFVWSSARVAGVPALEMLARSDQDGEKFRRDIEDEVRYANISIIKGIGVSQHGIGMVSARIAEIILRDERQVIPIGSCNPRYGVTFSLPSVVGRDGVLQVLEPQLSEDEQRALLCSAETLQAANARIPIVYGI